MPAADARPTAPHRVRVRRGLLGTLAAALAAAVTLIGCSSGSTTQKQRSDTYDGAVATVVVDFDDRGGGQIGTTDASLSARLVGAVRDGVQVDRTLEHTDGDQPKERVDQDGDTLTITVKCPGDFTIGTMVCRAAYEIEVPHGTAVRAASHSGSLAAEDTRAATELRSHDGDLTVTVTPDATRYAVNASSQDGETTVEVPEAPDGIPIHVASDHGDVTVRANTSRGRER